ncbi:MAG: hypothetical protein AAF487_02135 [Bacteroidota bacterium]
MTKNIYILAFCLLFLLSCASWNKLTHKHTEFHIASVNNNVCKKLKGDVVVYAIFVDSKYTGPWTEHDIYSTLDSIENALAWIESTSKEKGVPLSIQLEYHQNQRKTIPIEGKLVRKSLSQTIFGLNGVKNVDKWADKIAYTALKTLGTDTSDVTRTKVKPGNRERLIARLRDLHKTDNVALMYFINNYYTDEISCAIHCSADDQPEYAIVSFKEPAVIAHEFLHLFGAWDLYISPFDKKKKAIRKKAFAMREFPNEIMAFPYRKLDSLNISPFTEYLIGWENQLKEEHKNMILGKKLKVAKY